MIHLRAGNAALPRGRYAARDLLGASTQAAIVADPRGTIADISLAPLASHAGVMYELTPHR